MGKLAERPFEAVDHQDPSQLLMMKEEESELGFQIEKCVSDKRYFEMMDFASAHPKQYEVLKLRILHPEISVKQMSKILKMHRNSITKYLSILKQRKGVK